MHIYGEINLKPEDITVNGYPCAHQITETSKYAISIATNPLFPVIGKKSSLRDATYTFVWNRRISASPSSIQNILHKVDHSLRPRDNIQQTFLSVVVKKLYENRSFLRGFFDIRSQPKYSCNLYYSALNLPSTCSFPEGITRDQFNVVLV